MATEFRSASTQGRPGSRRVPESPRRPRAVLDAETSCGISSPLLPVTDLADFLRGSWEVGREILTAGQTVATFSGEATFDDQAPGELIYSEVGALVLPTVTLEARRDLLIRLLDAGCAELHFADGVAFHVLDLRRGRCRVVYRCGTDLYTGLYVAASPIELLVRWRCPRPQQGLRLHGA